MTNTLTTESTSGSTNAATILFGTNADTELLATRSIIEDLPTEVGTIRWFHPDRLTSPPVLDGVKAVIVRLLGGTTLWEEGLFDLRARCEQANIPFIALGGESSPNADMAAMSSVSAAIVAACHNYCIAGGPDNIANLFRFISDEVTGTAVGYDTPVAVPDVGIWPGAGLGPDMAGSDPARPLVGIIFYRAHLVAGNTTAIADLCTEVEDAGGDAVAIWAYSLRRDPAGEVPALALCKELGVDVIVTSTLAAGESVDEGEAWSVPGIEDAGIPVLQSPSGGRSREDWLADEAGLKPRYVATGVAIPEFDGRIIGPTHTFRETIEDDGQPGSEVLVTRADPERTRRLARLACNIGRLGRTPVQDRRIAFVLTAYPTKRARLGNAVGLDTPASTIELLQTMAGEGYSITDIPTDGDNLMEHLTSGFTYDIPTLTAEQQARTIGGLDTDRYTDWFTSEFNADAQADMTDAWGEAPGEVYVSDGSFHFPGFDLGNAIVTIQPPRGFGTDQIATYHAPDLAPPHHYMAFYRWLTSPQDEGGWGAHAIVHLGKHGTVEWLPGKALALTGSCFPDAALADIPFFYPFVVNDPGEGSQAKRRTHSVVIDHLPPPLTRADTYDDLARLEQLLDALANAEAMDPPKVPAMRQQVWEVLVSAQIHKDLDLGDEAPDEDSFDDMVLDVDGYLCALKDAQIRGGLHIMGSPPVGDALIDMVLAITRLPQGKVPSLRQTAADALGIDLIDASRVDTDRIEAHCREMIEAAAATGWDPAAATDPTIRWVTTALIPAFDKTTDELDNLLGGMAGKHVPAGPSGAPSRGMANVLPTGRNFYSVDPRAMPSELAWEVGQGLADRLIERYKADTGEFPTSVGLVLWGTAAMRTSGDDAAQALALIGVRPTWDEQTRRITGLEAIPFAELGRPRVDVTLRISGFFRDAFPHVIELLDEAVELAAALDEPAGQNPLAVSGTDDARIFGPPPGGYGTGILPVIEEGTWDTQADLAEVYLAWSGYAYGRDRHGDADPGAMRRRFATIQVAVKNQDNREHDIFDSDDYLQDHGGMVAAVRALTGHAPKAYFGDSANPANPQVRSLKEEAARVVRSRVLNPKWIGAMQNHGYKGAFEMAATVDYMFGYDATAEVVEDWMYDKVTDAYIADPDMKAFFEKSNPWAYKAIAERLLEADRRDMWDASDEARDTLQRAVAEAEGWEESR